MVYPSGLLLLTVSSPMAPEAPVVFCTITVVPIAFSNSEAKIRDVVSEAPPAAYGQTIVMALLPGKSAALADAAAIDAHIAVAAKIDTVFFMFICKSSL